MRDPGLDERQDNGIRGRRVRLTPPALLPEVRALPAAASRLARVGRYPATLVTAPAGFGKTTQLALWFQLHPRAAWVSLAPEDDDPALLFRLLAAAVATVEPELARGLDQVAAAGSDDPRLLADSLSDLLADLPGDLALVLDDVHELASPRSLALLDRLLRYPPARLHLVLAGRLDPPIPALDLLDQRGVLLRLDVPDLLFTLPDVLRLLPDDLPDRDRLAASILDRVEGWPAGVRAFTSLHSPEGRSDARTGHRNLAALRRFVAGEVLARQPAAAVALLRSTAVLPFLTPSLAAVHGGMSEPSARRILDRLVETGAFVATDASGGYRVHAVVRETLQEQLGPEAVAAQHAAVAEWFAQRGEVSEAAVHAFAAGAGFAADLIERHVFTWLLRKHVDEINAAISRLPEELVQRRPALLAALAATLVTRGLGARAMHLAESADALLDEMDRRDPNRLETRRLRWEATSVRCFASQFTVQIAESLDLARTVIDAPEASVHARGNAISAWAFGSIELGRLDEVEQALGEIAGSSPVARIRLAALMGLMAAAYHRLDPVRLETWARLAAEDAERHGFSRELAWGHFALGYCAYERNDLAAADVHAAAGHAVSAGSSMVAAHQFTILRARIAAARGRSAEAFALADADFRGLQRVGAVTLLPIAAAHRARWAAAIGDVSGLDGPMPAGLLDAPMSPSQAIGPAAALLGAALLERNQPGDARRAADLLQAFRNTQAARHPGRLAEALPLLATALELAGDRAAALAVMAETLGQEPGHFFRRFADAGPAVLPVLADLASSGGPATESAARVLAALASREPETGPLAALTARERDVLSLMAAWMTNKEIAGRLGISVETVRQHTRAIYRKLGVGDRREAVALAAAGAGWDLGAGQATATS